MYFTSFTLATTLAVSSLSNLLTTVAATPLIPNLLQERQDGSSSSTITPPDRYRLQTKVIDNSTDYGSNKDGLWIYSYHTGAGLGDVGLSSNMSIGWEAYLNGTRQLFTYPNAFAPWPLKVKYGPYQGWFVTTISVSDQPTANDPGFFFNSTGLQYNYTNGGWLACDWWHGVPQLFNLAYYSYGAISASCSKVELYPIAI